MKISLVTLALLLSAAAGFAQGKLLLENDIDQMVYLTPDKSRPVPADKDKIVNGYPLAGSSLHSGADGTLAALDGSPTIIASLFAGTTAEVLTLVTTTTLDNIDFAGRLYPVYVTFDGLPAGTSAFFRIDIFDSRNSSAEDAWSMNDRYAGTTGLFECTPQDYYASIYNPMPPTYSTMPRGTFVPLEFKPYPGFLGLIEVYATIPEPSTLGLAVPGAAALMVARRRK